LPSGTASKKPIVRPANTPSPARRPASRRADKTTKGELSRLHLLKAAARVFKAKGYSDATIRDIAREAGIALGGLYFHFKNKHEFVGAVLTHGMASIDSHARAKVAALPSGISFRQRLGTALDAHFEAIGLHGEFTSMRDVFGEWTPDAWDEYRAARESYRRFWSDLVAEGKASGEVRADIDTTTMVFFILGSVTWMSEWYDPARGSGPRILRDFGTMFVEGVQPAAD
jgi:AcrR family transcriptional regulator